ncbi:GDSL-type esterase/lipase family protein [uncultured Enterovirga sp.]|uniref:GDSL-type esterase/lipase family protein n=1 Tax=uncultured Enterovirga sp. TaxID=2026352 RepID=UPI0035CBCE1C
MFRKPSWLALVAVVLAAPASEAQQGRQIHLVVLGDSLSAGFLISSSTAFPAVLERALRQRGLPVVVTNAAVSGDTAADGLARLDRDVPEGTDGVVLELGANDKLKRQDPGAAQAALAEIVRRLTARRIPVLVAGIRFTDAAGAPYNGIFRAVARRYRSTYYADIYAGLASDARFTIFDRTHPSPEGVAVMVAGILPTAERFVRGPVAARLRR